MLPLTGSAVERREVGPEGRMVEKDGAQRTSWKLQASDSKWDFTAFLDVPLCGQYIQWSGGGQRLLMD